MKTIFCRILTAIALVSLLVSLSAACVVQAADTGYTMPSAYSSRTDKEVNVQVDISVAEAKDNVTVYLASYDIDGKFLCLKTFECPTETTTGFSYCFEDETTVNVAYSVKVMLLDENHVPLTAAQNCVIKDSDNILDVGPLFK